MKTFVFFFCLMLSFVGFSQSLSVGIGLGILMPHNKIDHLKGASPYFYSTGLPSGNGLLNLVYKPNNIYYWELMFTRYSPMVAGRYHDETRTTTIGKGTSSAYYSIALGRNIATFKQSQSYIFGAVAIEHNSPRFTSFPNSIGLIQLYDYKVKYGYFPSLQAGINWQLLFRKKKKSTLTVQLMGNLGFVYSRYYFYYAQVEDGEIIDAVIKRKGDFVNLSVRYNYSFLQRKQKSK